MSQTVTASFSSSNIIWLFVLLSKKQELYESPCSGITISVGYLLVTFHTTFTLIALRAPYKSARVSRSLSHFLLLLGQGGNYFLISIMLRWNNYILRVIYCCPQLRVVSYIPFRCIHI